ncbi:MAG: TonB-dependent receptor [Pseudomonadota bacterium]
MKKLLVAAAVGLSLSSGAIAQDVFEEIVVLAQKREQNIMEVPVAVSALSGTQLVDAGIKDVFDLQQNVPNLIIGQSQTATTTNFAIRGIGSTSNNFGVESSVGLYVDGVYRSRQSSLINEMIDVEFIEVLRGPQGTLFGKNTAAGAIQVRTVAPSQDRDAFVDVTAGDLGLIRVSGAANIPVNDNLAFRGTIFSSQRDGYVDDIALGDDVYNDRDRLGVRLQMLYEPNDDANLRVIVDYAEIDEVCCVGITTVDGLYSQGSLGGVPVPGSDAALLQFGGTVFTRFDYPQPFLDALAGLPGSIITGGEFDDLVAANNFLPESQNEDSGISVEYNQTFDNGVTFTSISAFRTFDTFDRSDVDFTDVDLFTRINDVSLDSFSQEFRIGGEFGSGHNFVLGAYYFAQEIDQFTSTTGTPLTEIYLNANPLVADITTLVDTVAGLAGAPYQPAGTAFLPDVQSADSIVQDQDGYAVFGQVDFALGDNFVLTLGGRYTDESKKIRANYTQNTPAGPRPDFGAISFWGCVITACDPAVPPFNPADLANPEVFAVFAPYFVDGWGAYAFPPIAPRPNLSDTLADDQTTGNVKLTWFPSDTTMFYTSFSTGFKSGGTNTERISPAFDPLFGAETSESFEIGFKGDLGPVRLAFTYFDAEFDDFQAQTFTGTGFNLQNAGSIDNTGYELELLWRPFDTFEAQLIYTHTEADYGSFENGTCWDAFTFHTGIPDPGLPPSFNPVLDAEVCNKTGNPLAYNPEDRLFVSLQQEFNLSTDNNMFVRLEYSSASDQLTDGDLDPFTFQDDFEILNARIGLNLGKSNSSLTLWGRNLTDEVYLIGSADAPVQVGRMFGYPSEPATYGLTYRKNFD